MNVPTQNLLVSKSTQDYYSFHPVSTFPLAIYVFCQVTQTICYPVLSHNEQSQVSESSQYYLKVKYQEIQAIRN
jgi:hypothetical protein